MCLIEHHAVKSYEGSDVRLRSF